MGTFQAIISRLLKPEPRQYTFFGLRYKVFRGVFKQIKKHHIVTDIVKVCFGEKKYYFITDEFKQ